MSHYKEVKKFMSGLTQILKKEAIVKNNDGKVFFNDIELWTLSEFGFSKKMLMHSLTLLEEAGKITINKTEGYATWNMGVE